MAYVVFTYASFSVTVHGVQWPVNRKRSNISSGFEKTTVVIGASGTLKPVVKSPLIPDPRELIPFFLTVTDISYIKQKKVDFQL